MSQTINIISTTSPTFGDFPTQYNENVATLRSQFSGTSFPSSPTVGQPCFRSDLGETVTGGGTTGQWFIYSGNTNAGQSGWVLPSDMSSYTKEIINSRGSKLTLDQRLDIALNEDGTLKDTANGVISEFQNYGATNLTYVSSSIFTVDNNATDIFKSQRKIKINLDGSFHYADVTSSSYDGGLDKTTVVTNSTTIDNTLLSVEYFLISPEYLDLIQNAVDLTYSNVDSGLYATNVKLGIDENSRKDKSVIHNITVDADYTLTDLQNQYGRVEITDTGVLLTTTRNIIVDNKEHTFLFVNSTARSLIVKTLAGTGIAVLSGKTKELRCDGTNVIEYEVSGFEIATTAEAQAGTDNTKAITPLRLREGLNASGTAPIYACRAWVNFNGTGTVAIRASGNVSSITDNGTGDYNINLITAIEDVNYSVEATGCRSAEGAVYGAIAYTPDDYTITSFRVKNTTDAGIPEDAYQMNIAVFR